MKESISLVASWDKMAFVPDSEQTAIRREKTAIARFRHSKPVWLALSHSIIAATRSFFDYGCGRGEDFRYLSADGVEASGWDPHYRPEAAVVEADVVNLGYVLNVIEDPAERDATLQRAYGLARRVLVAAVRVDNALESAVEFSDGLLTSRGSFQKLYKQSEFKDYLERVLGKRPHMAALGIAYIFKDDELESSYLVSLARKRVDASRTSATAEFQQDAVAQRYVDLSSALGRPAVPSEFEDYAALRDRFGSPARIERLAGRLLSADTVQETLRRKRDDILIYAALMRLQALKPIAYRFLPTELQADIKTIWPSYAAALREADDFLFQLGNAESVRCACQSSPIGKKLPDVLYVHRSAEEQMGALLRLIVLAAHQIVGEVDYNVLKIGVDGRSLSLLKYDDFEGDAHPALRHSVRVYLPRAEYSIRDYSDSSNPPILHRKEMLVDAIHPSYSDFCELSEQEEQLGLLSRPDIGTKQSWLATLAENHLTIRGHSVYSTNEPV